MLIAFEFVQQITKFSNGSVMTKAKKRIILFLDRALLKEKLEKFFLILGEILTKLKSHSS